MKCSNKNLYTMFITVLLITRASQAALVVKNPPDNAGDIRDVGLIPKLGRFPEEGNGNPLQYSCLENPMDRGGWQAIVHGVAKSQTRLKRLSILMMSNGGSNSVSIK